MRMELFVVMPTVVSNVRKYVGVSVMWQNYSSRHPRRRADLSYLTVNNMTIRIKARVFVNDTIYIALNYLQLILPIFAVSMIHEQDSITKSYD